MIRLGGSWREARLEAHDADAFAATTEDDADAGKWDAAHDAARTAQQNFLLLLVTCFNHNLESAA